MKNIYPIVPEAPIIYWESSIQNGFSFSSTYESTNGREYNNDGADDRLRLEIHRSTKEIKSLGIIYEDLQKIQVVENRQP